MTRSRDARPPEAAREDDPVHTTDPSRSVLDVPGVSAARIQRKLVQRLATRRGEGTEAVRHGPLVARTGDEQVEEAAARGTRGAGGPLPHLEVIQRSFGRHDVGHVRAHTDEAAQEGARAMRAAAFATGDHVAFAGAPDLHTAAHEAAHVVQQRGGVQLKGGVGEEGDVYEQHADAVADRVVRGESSEALLDAFAGASPSTGAPPVQRTKKWEGDHAVELVADEQVDLALYVLRYVPELRDNVYIRRDQLARFPLMHTEPLSAQPADPRAGTPSHPGGIDVSFGHDRYTRDEARPSFILGQGHVATSEGGGVNIYSGGFAGCLGVVICPVRGDGGQVSHISQTGNKEGTPEGKARYLLEAASKAIVHACNRWGQVDVVLFRGDVGAGGAAIEYPELAERLRQGFDPEQVRTIDDQRGRRDDGDQLFLETRQRSLLLFKGQPSPSFGMDLAMEEDAVEEKRRGTRPSRPTREGDPLIPLEEGKAINATMPLHTFE